MLLRHSISGQKTRENGLHILRVNVTERLIRARVSAFLGTFFEKLHLALNQFISTYQMSDEEIQAQSLNEY